MFMVWLILVVISIFLLAFSVSIVEIQSVNAFYKLTNARAQMKSYVFDVIRSSLPCMSLDESFENKDDNSIGYQKRVI